MTFYEGGKYKDAVGRVWCVIHTVTSPKNERLLLVKRDRLLTNQWAVAIDNLDDTATVLEDIGFTTLYAEGEE